MNHADNINTTRRVLRPYTLVVRCSTKDSEPSLPTSQPILAGRCVVGFARHASEDGVTTQIATLQRVVEAAGAALVGMYDQVGGLSPSCISRNTLDQIIQRKRESADFDVLIVTELSRLSRGGIDHAYHIANFLADAGIEVISRDQLA